MKPGYEKRFKNGDIVYWCHREGNANYSVHWGMVDEQFSDAVVIDYLVHKENRLIDGVPIDEFKPEQRYKKLPKEWNRGADLFNLTYEKFPFDDEQIDLKDPENIKEAYEKGWLVKDSTIFHGNIETEIEKQGYRVILKYDKDALHHFDHRSVRPDKVYFTYEEAKKEVDDNIAEFFRQASLSDYDWSVEQIDHTLDRWQNIQSISDEEKLKYRNWLLNMKNVEDIETRIFNGEIQWKYWENKRWNYIEL